MATKSRMQVDHFPVLLPRQHTNYDCLPKGRRENLEAILDLLKSTSKLENGTIKKIHEETKIPLGTIKTWRRKLLANPNATVIIHGARGISRILDKEIEDQIYKKIMSDYILQKRYCSLLAIQTISKQIIGDTIPNFKGSRTWAQGFLKRHGLSIRSPHVKRRSEYNDDIISKFVAEFDVALMQLPPKLILNMDESAWRIVNGRLRTVARKGDDDVTVLLKADPKETLTIIATINAEGEKFPIILIANGKTERCEEKFRNDKRLRKYISQGDLVIMHSKSGWATAELMKQYLKWLTGKIEKRNAYLLWDLHSSHRDEDVKKYSTKKNIQLSYIPAGQTGEWQPLDRKIFGNLKKQCHYEFEKLLINHSIDNYDIVDAIVILMEIWKKIPEETVKKSWNHLIGQNQDEFPEISE